MHTKSKAILMNFSRISIQLSYITFLQLIHEVEDELLKL